MTKIRNGVITVFVVVWCLVFHYESIRHFYLEPFLGRPLPKVKFLYPPAGWIMFFQVDSAYGNVRIFGVRKGQYQEIDPHDIFRVRTIGFDNIHRGIMGVAASKYKASAFCRQLERRFDGFDNFAVVQDYYPDFIKDPYEQYQQVLYTCKK